MDKKKDPDKHSEIDISIVEKAIAGDPIALAMVYDSYAKDIYRYLYSRVGNVADAEELTAQTFMAVIESLPRYRHRGYFSAWIFQIARNKAIDFFRKQRWELIDLPYDAAYTDEVTEQIIKGQAYEHLSKLLKNLKEDEQELIRLRFTAELSYVEIARLLGRKEDSVRKSIHRILERLYSQIEVQNV
jgi:RNA polymerase sigma-70 factor (ECF subfamily)